MSINEDHVNFRLISLEKEMKKTIWEILHRRHITPIEAVGVLEWIKRDIMIWGERVIDTNPKQDGTADP
jgi:hypothetical protein